MKNKENILISGLIVVVFIVSIVISGCTDKEKSEIDEEGDRLGAIMGGYYLGILASTYAPWIPEYADSEMARKDSTMALNASADLLNIKLVPDPASLLSSGRGMQQYDVTLSYFEQINEQIDENSQEYSQCTISLARMSLYSGWLMLDTYEAEPLIRYQYSTEVVKNIFYGHITKFSVFAGTAGVFCKDEENPQFSLMLHAISKDSLIWRERIILAEDDEIIDEMRLFRYDLDMWNNGLLLVK